MLVDVTVAVVGARLPRHHARYCHGANTHHPGVPSESTSTSTSTRPTSSASACAVNDQVLLWCVQYSTVAVRGAHDRRAIAFAVPTVPSCGPSTPVAVAAGGSTTCDVGAETPHLSSENGVEVQLPRRSSLEFSNDVVTSTNGGGGGQEAETTTTTMTTSAMATVALRESSQRAVMQQRRPQQRQRQRQSVVRSRFFPLRCVGDAVFVRGGAWHRSRPSEPERVLVKMVVFYRCKGCCRPQHPSSSSSSPSSSSEPTTTATSRGGCLCRRCAALSSSGGALVKRPSPAAVVSLSPAVRRDAAEAFREVACLWDSPRHLSCRSTLASVAATEGLSLIHI